MRGHRRATTGFTIVETLIVLAVTGALFLMAALTINGKQNRTQFNQASQDIRSRLQQIINEVASGYYPNNSNFACTPGGSGPILAAGSTAQGENTGCIFLGKVIQFGVNGTDPEGYNVFTLAGLQQVTAGGDEVTSYSEAKPKVVAPNSGEPALPNASETGTLKYGLTVYKAYYGSAATPIGAIAFASSLPTYNSGSLNSTSQQVNVIPIASSALHKTAAETASTINTNFATSPVNPDGGVYICVASAGTDQSGLILLGGGGRQLSVTMTIWEHSTTCS